MKCDDEDRAILRACLTRNTVPDAARARRLEQAGYLLAGSASYELHRSFETTTKGRLALGDK